jgi:hypothetical protein
VRQYQEESDQAKEDIGADAFVRPSTFERPSMMLLLTRSKHGSPRSIT